MIKELMLILNIESVVGMVIDNRSVHKTIYLAKKFYLINTNFDNY